jgi:hypothetical protein
VAARYQHLRLPGFSMMLAALLVGLGYFRCIHQSLLADPDIGWHLRNAQLLFQQHEFIRHDSYTFSLSGAPWINPEWLSEVFYYAAWRWFGISGLEAFSILLLELLTIGVCFLAWQRTHSLRAAVLAATIFLLFSSVTTGPRTQLCGWLCCIVLLALLEQFRTAGPGRRTHVWALPFLFALWINLHGSWPIGIVLLVAYIACSWLAFSRGLILSIAWTPAQRNHLLVITALSFAALFVNPYGWRLVGYPFVVAGHHPLTMAIVQEWQSLDFHPLRGRLVFLVVAALLFARAFSARRWTLYDTVSRFIAVSAGFTYSRFLLLTGIILCPQLADEMTFVGKDDPSVEKPVLNTAIIAMVALYIVLAFPNKQELTRQQNELYPAGAVAYLQQHPATGPVLNEFNWGGYIIWNLPNQPVFIDTRTDVFEETGLLKNYMDLVSLHQPVDTFHNSQFQYVFFPVAATLTESLKRSPNWSIVYQDDIAIIFKRK